MHSVYECTYNTDVVQFFLWLVSGFSLRRPEFSPRVVSVTFVVDTVTLGQISAPVHRVFAAIYYSTTVLAGPVQAAEPRDPV
jgi:hypothetical protein